VCLNFIRDPFHNKQMIGVSRFVFESPSPYLSLSVHIRVSRSIFESPGPYSSLPVRIRVSRSVFESPGSYLDERLVLVLFSVSLRWSFRFILLRILGCSGGSSYRCAGGGGGLPPLPFCRKCGAPMKGNFKPYINAIGIL